MQPAVVWAIDPVRLSGERSNPRYEIADRRNPSIARHVAARFGWRPTSQVSWLLLLASDEVETAVQQRREVLRKASSSRAAQMREVFRGAVPAGDGSRGRALIDPSSRRSEWLVATRSDGRRSFAPYREYADAARRIAS